MGTHLVQPSVQAPTEGCPHVQADSFTECVLAARKVTCQTTKTEPTSTRSGQRPSISTTTPERSRRCLGFTVAVHAVLKPHAWRESLSLLKTIVKATVHRGGAPPEPFRGSSPLRLFTSAVEPRRSATSTSRAALNVPVVPTSRKGREKWGTPSDWGAVGVKVKRQGQRTAVSVLLGRRFAPWTAEAAVSTWFEGLAANSRFLLCASRIVGMTNFNLGS